jgi:hypothetical protein
VGEVAGRFGMKVHFVRCVGEFLPRNAVVESLPSGRFKADLEGNFLLHGFTHKFTMQAQVAERQRFHIANSFCNSIRSPWG